MNAHLPRTTVRTYTHLTLNPLFYNVLYTSNTISNFLKRNHKMGNSNEEAGATTRHETMFSLQHNSAAFPFHSL